MTKTAFYTIATARYFPGLVALLNSLRLVGHDEELVVLDEGLTPDQRARLEPHATLVTLPSEGPRHPALLKAFPAILEPEGVVAIIDSDMIVTRSLDEALADARAGRIVVFRDHESSMHRWFAEWERDFELAAPPRHQVYVNAGFLAVSQEWWPDFLTRWWKACERIPSSHVAVLPRLLPRRTALARERLWCGDQDALNAILMSEVAADALAVRPDHEQPDWLTEAEVVDARTLESSYHDEPVSILHFSLGPKPWERNGWRRARRSPYVELLPRVLLADDVALRLEPDELPRWLRGDARANAALTALDRLWRSADGLERVGRAGAQRLPGRVRGPLLRLRDRIADRSVS